jgi:hypothetical protein
MSILETKIRKKIMLINADPRNMMKKLKDIDVLRKFILYPKKYKKKVVHEEEETPKKEKKKPDEKNDADIMPIAEEEDE